MAARTLIEEALAIRRELANKSGIALFCTSLGRVARNIGDYDAARNLIEEALTIRRELADKVGIAMALYCLGHVLHSQGDYEAVRRVMTENLTLFRQKEHSYVIHALGLLGHAARDSADYAQARALYHESLLLRQELGNVYAICMSVEGFAGLAIRQREWERAARLLGAVDSLFTTLGHAHPIATQAEFRGATEALQSALGAEGFAKARTEGRAISLEQAITYALTQDGSSSQPDF